VLFLTPVCIVGRGKPSGFCLRTFAECSVRRAWLGKGALDRDSGCKEALAQRRAWLHAAGYRCWRFAPARISSVSRHAGRPRGDLSDWGGLEPAAFGQRELDQGEPARVRPRGRHRSTGGFISRTPGAAAGWNKPARLRKEKTPEGARNAERGTDRGLGTPGEWTSGASFAGGDRTLWEVASGACRLGRPPLVILWRGDPSSGEASVVV
jgi:hypothetical protein